MKRSEMVRYISNFLYTVNPVYGYGHFAIRYAEHILEIVESKGMLPPKTKLNALNIEDNAWEPEDE